VTHKIILRSAVPQLGLKKLSDDAPSSFLAVAADEWDRKYRSASMHAENVFITKVYHPGIGIEENNVAYRSAITEIFRTRLFVPEQASARKHPRMARRKSMYSNQRVSEAGANAFDPYHSFWTPRIAWSDAKSLYDTNEVKFLRFERDLKRAVKLGLIRQVTLWDDDHDADVDGDGIPDEVEDVAAVLWQHYDFLHRLFTTYATLNGELNYLTLNDWIEFVVEAKLANNKSKFCKVSDLDTVFITCDSAKEKSNMDLGSLMQGDMHLNQSELESAEGTKHHGLLMGGPANREGLTRQEEDPISMAGVSTRKRALGRVEFIIGIVWIAIRKYVMPGKIEDVSDALERLLRNDISTRLGVTAFPDPDTIRRCYCYTQTMCAMLFRYETTLRRIFTALAQGRKTISLSQWRLFLSAVHLIGDDVSVRHAARCFAWSRMCVIDGLTMLGTIKETHLNFEGFAEALIRLSILKAIPTPEDVDSHGCTSAREYLQNLRPSKEQFKSFIALRGTPWGHVPKAPEPEYRLEVTIDIIVYAIESSSAFKEGGDGQLSEREVGKWFDEHVFKDELTAGGAGGGVRKGGGQARRTNRHAA